MEKMDLRQQRSIIFQGAYFARKSAIIRSNGTTNRRSCIASPFPAYTPTAGETTLAPQDGVLPLKGSIEERAQDLALYIIEDKAAVRAAAVAFGVSKSTVHRVYWKSVKCALRVTESCNFRRKTEYIVEKRSKLQYNKGGPETTVSG